MIDKILDLGVAVTQYTDRLAFYTDGAQQLFVLPNMFTESVPFYFLTILMVKKWGRRRFLHSLGLGFIIMLGLHLVILTLVATIYPIAFKNQASITLTMKAFAISSSYLLWHGMHYNQRKDAEAHLFHEHDE